MSKDTYITIPGFHFYASGKQVVLYDYERNKIRGFRALEDAADWLEYYGYLEASKALLKQQLKVSK